MLPVSPLVLALATLRRETEEGRFSQWRSARTREEEDLRRWASNRGA